MPWIKMEPPSIKAEPLLLPPPRTYTTVEVILQQKNEKRIGHLLSEYHID